ncbi:MAG: ATP-binding protein [Steroidobacteraceae bacterium]
MRRRLPDTLTGWVIVVLVAGLALSQVATVVVNYRTRNSTATVLEHFRLAERVADIVRLVEGAAPADRSRMLASLEGPTLRASLGSAPALPDAPPRDWHARLLGELVQSALGDVAWRELRVALTPAAPTGSRSARDVGRRPAGTPGVARSVDEIIARHDDASLLRVSLELADGSWINFEAPLVEEGSVLSPWSAPLALLAALVIVAATIAAVRRLTAPLTALVRAADQLGRDVNAPPLPETGPYEFREAARAFNQMQSRIRRFVRDRTLMVAAMSHDLRTPITRLRLRAEFVDDEEQRRRMLGDLADMEAMVDSTLAFVRQEENTEAVASADLVSLVGGVCEDRPAVTFATGEGVGVRLPYVCRPLSLARCIGNLVDNAVRYGGEAQVGLVTRGGEILVTVEDPGPGIPASERERAFAPFTRLDAARNLDNGGTGLGLTIARTIARAHGGDVELGDRPGGGLRATVRLPAA